MKQNTTHWIWLMAVCLLLTQCTEPAKDSTAPSKVATTQIAFPKNQSQHTAGENIVITVQSKVAPDNIQQVAFYVDDELRFTDTSELHNFNWSTESERVGLRKLSTVTTLTDGSTENSQVLVMLSSNIKPVEYTYQVVNTYAHDPRAYTQGLVIEDGVLFEGTGVKGASSLRKVNLKTGEVTQQKDLESRLFGEGIAILDNRIFQLTYLAHIGFIYNKEDFSLISQFSYSGQGWGLSHDSTNLLMSDGSNIISFLDPNTLRKVHQIQVLDDKGPVEYLNELEYINGEIYSNIYQSDRVVRIDPKTGKVLASIDLSNLLTEQEWSKLNRKDHVLNGIAFDPDNDRLYVTGKYWPKLFEIKLVER